MQLKRNYTVKTAGAFVIASMVGTGVFTSLGYQVMHTDSAFSIMLLWSLGGLASICGALTYCALALVMPRSGGEYHYLSTVYGKGIGYAAGVITVVVGFSAPIALSAMAFGKYLAHIVPVPPELLGFACLALVTLMHLFDVRKGGQAHVWATVLKVSLLFLFLVLACFYSDHEVISFAPSTRDWGLIGASSFGVSLVYVTYSYTGWNAAVYVLDELENPQRDIPRALLWGVGVVTALYLALNAVFLWTTPMDLMAGKEDFAFYVGQRLVGDNGAALMALLIAIGLISTLSAMMVTASRVVFRMAEDDPLLKLFSQTNAKGTPSVAILLVAIFSLLFLLSGQFSTVLEFAGFILSFFGIFAVLALFIYKARNPGIKMPFGAWFFPLVPIVYLLIKLLVVTYMIWDDPSRIMQSIITFALAYGCYLTSNAQRGPKNDDTEKRLVSDK